MQDLVISEILEGYGDIKSLSYAVEYLLEKANGNSITIYIFSIVTEPELGKLNKKNVPEEEKAIIRARIQIKKTRIEEAVNKLKELYPNNANGNTIELCTQYLDSWSDIFYSLQDIVFEQVQFRYVIATNIHRRITLIYEDSTDQGLPSGINYRNFYSFLRGLHPYFINLPPTKMIFITDLNRNLTNKLFATVVEATYPFTQITRNNNGLIQHRESYQYKNLEFTIFVPHINMLKHKNEFSPSAALSPAIPQRERLRFYNFKPPNQSFKKKIIIKAYIPETKERNGKIVDPTNFTQELFQEAIKSDEVRKALYILGFTKETTILMHGTTDMPDRVYTEDKDEDEDKLTGYHFSEVKDQKSDEFLESICRSDLFICSGAHSAQEALSLNDDKDTGLGLIVYCASHHMFELARQMNALLPEFIHKHLNPINQPRAGNSNDGIISALSNIIILSAYNKLFRYSPNPNVPVLTPAKIESVATHFPDFNQSQDRINDLCTKYQLSSTPSVKKYVNHSLITRNTLQSFSSASSF